MDDRFVYVANRERLVRTFERNDAFAEASSFKSSHFDLDCSQGCIFGNVETVDVDEDTVYVLGDNDNISMFSKGSHEKVCEMPINVDTVKTAATDGRIIYAGVYKHDVAAFDKSRIDIIDEAEINGQTIIFRNVAKVATFHGLQASAWTIVPDGDLLHAWSTKDAITWEKKSGQVIKHVEGKRAFAVHAAVDGEHLFTVMDTANRRIVSALKGDGKVDAVYNAPSPVHHLVIERNRVYARTGENAIIAWYIGDANGHMVEFGDDPVLAFLKGLAPQEQK